MPVERIRLLLVDNEVLFLNALSRRLSLKDFEITPITSGQDALRLAQKAQFDVALVDICAAQMSAKVAKELFQKAQPLLEVVFLAKGECSESDTPQLSKSVETTELLRHLKEAYQRKLQNKYSLTSAGLNALMQTSPQESSLSVLRKLKEVDVQLSLGG